MDAFIEAYELTDKGSTENGELISSADKDNLDADPLAAGFEEILRTIPKYGKNDITLARYLNCHREIQGLLTH